MQNQNAYFICTKHPNQRVTSINFDESNGESSRLLCSSCLIDLLNQTYKKNYQLVDIDEFLKNPIHQLQRVMKYDGSKTFSDLDNLQQFEKEITLIEDKFKQTIIGLKVCVQEIKNLKDKFQQDFLKLSSCNSLIEKYDTARQIQENELKKTYIKYFEEHLNYVCQNLNQAKLQASHDMIKSQEVITNIFQKHLQASIQDIKRLKEVSIATFNFNNIQGLPILIYGELRNFPQIHYKISEGKAISYQLFYQGSRDGLNFKQFYSKCSYYYHLLTIITTKNGNKFGGYSHCQLKNNEVDAQLKSFLFQYNRQEIYKIKNQQTSVYNAQYENCKFGFGDGDLVFDGNLTKCSSNLGMSYDISNHNVYDRSTHIFGESNPQIQEFKVYKVIFQ